MLKEQFNCRKVEVRLGYKEKSEFHAPMFPKEAVSLPTK